MSTGSQVLTQDPLLSPTERFLPKGIKEVLPSPELANPISALNSQNGLLSRMPASCVPFAQLMRLDKPAGFWPYYMPSLLGLGYGACTAQSAPSPGVLFSLCGLFYAYCFFLRGAACCWNDTMDQDFDRQVGRTRNRPIARGAVTTTQAHLFTAACVLAQGPFLMMLPLVCTYHAIFMNVLFGVYALMKRVTYYPQVFLGFPFAWSIFIGCASLGVDFASNDRIFLTTMLFTVVVLWTVICDTVYAHQDIKDDVKAGVKSVAVRFADSTKELLSMLVFFLVALLLGIGSLAHLSALYFMFTCCGSAALFIMLLAKVDLKEPASCASFFYAGFFYGGLSLVSGFAIEYAAREICGENFDLEQALLS
ncbi:uncharacterized protein KY384_007305 [Bacidia gigantensis]|uniref:uncharacterized protein n=1 Tax=Bacidia gigantensis TaxID=2732470 RepID=UPI001D0455FE|nr:uncharacterized protein KY384_007305 [Bacidia gigantensis]KAG8528387.1 hypothetical protein KY384_007305 [Bacidia gigantensis]